MASIREMRGHIKSIDSIGQMTRALQAVSASRVRAATQLAEQSAPYAETAWKVLMNFYRQNGSDQLSKVFHDHHKDDKVLVIFISADRGLAGSFPANIFRETAHLEQRLKKDPLYITIGKKGREMLARRKKKIIADFSNIHPVSIEDEDLKAISRIILTEYCSEEIDAVYLVYTKYESISHYTPITQLLLPFSKGYQQYMRDNQIERFEMHDYLIEGDIDTFLDGLILRVLNSLIFHAILSSRASEHSARMLAMSNATENAEHVKSELQLEYNKIRQQTITNDILDIVGGAEAQHQDFERILKRKNSILQQEA